MRLYPANRFLLILFNGVLFAALFFAIATFAQTESKNNNLMLVYLKTEDLQGKGDLIITNDDGSIKQTIQTVQRSVYPMFNHDISDDGGKLIYSLFSGDSIIISGHSRREGKEWKNPDVSLWIKDGKTTPQKLFSVPQGSLLSQALISPDGLKIVYIMETDYTQPLNQQLWMINTEGKEKKLLFDKINKNLPERSPFRFSLLAWSKDKRKIYLTLKSEGSAPYPPVGFYEFDLISKKIKKANTPQIYLEGLIFSCDKSKIAFATEKRTGMGEPPSGPYTLQITSINNGETKEILTNNKGPYSNPSWSPNGSKIAFTLTNYTWDKDGSLLFFDSSLCYIDLNLNNMFKVLPIKRNHKIAPEVWLSENRLTYTEIEEEIVRGPIKTSLFSVNIDGTNKKLIDSAKDIIVFGKLK